jgi:hypothetical protein
MFPVTATIDSRPFRIPLDAQCSDYLLGYQECQALNSRQQQGDHERALTIPFKKNKGKKEQRELLS